LVLILIDFQLSFTVIQTWNTCLSADRDFLMAIPG
jgi:hypothetical protein